MRKIACIVFILCLSITAAMAQEPVSISRYQGEKITGIEVRGAVQVVARQGESTGVKVTVPARLENKLVLELRQDGVLYITLEGKEKWKKNDKCRAEITVSTLESILLTGACSLDFSGEITVDRFKAEVIGASSVRINNPLRVTRDAEISVAGVSKFTGELTAESVYLKIAGTSTLSLSGSCNEAEIDVAGVSKAELENFPAGKAKVKVAGTSHANMHVLKELHAKAFGVSTITYSGDPKVVNAESAGISRIKRK